jgi:hypothetical protein
MSDEEWLILGVAAFAAWALWHRHPVVVSPAADTSMDNDGSAAGTDALMAHAAAATGGGGCCSGCQTV